MIKNFVSNKTTRKSAIFAAAFFVTCLAALMDVKSPEPAQPEGSGVQAGILKKAAPPSLKALSDSGFLSIMQELQLLRWDAQIKTPEQQSAGKDEEQPDVKDEEQPDGKDEEQPDGKDEEQPDGKDEEQPDGKDKEQPDGKDEEQLAVAVMQPVTLPAPSGPIYDDLGFSYLSEIDLSEDLQRYTYQRCQKTGLEYEMVLAIMWRESRFQPHAVGVNTNGTKDSGLMQINDVNRAWLEDEHGISDLLDPYQNIDAGTTILAQFYSKYGEDQALMAYQYGEGGMLRKVAQGITTNEKTEMAKFKRDEYKLLRMDS